MSVSEVTGRGGVGVPALLDWVREFAARVADGKDELTRLDSAIGDADHGGDLPIRHEGSGREG